MVLCVVEVVGGGSGSVSIPNSPCSAHLPLGHRCPTGCFWRATDPPVWELFTYMVRSRRRRGGVGVVGFLKGDTHKHTRALKFSRP